jgi:hypothetical protein
MDPHIEQLLNALDSFKDWSNYLLVTTVAALGWVATKDRLTTLSPIAVRFVICILAFSVVCGIFTLGLVPLIAERITTDTTSIYDVWGRFRPLYLFGPYKCMRLKMVCWLQHVSFIVAIVVYATVAAKATKRTTMTVPP